LQDNFSGITLTFNGVGMLYSPETQQFEKLMKNWFESYLIHSGRALQIPQVRNMETTIEV